MEKSRLHVAKQFLFVEDKVEQLVIMAGGRGKRLMPLTASTPKPMLPINGKPILEHIVHKAKDDGFINLVISVNYLSHIIEDYFEDGSRFGVNISYLHEHKPMGTVIPVDAA